MSQVFFKIRRYFALFGQKLNSSEILSIKIGQNYQNFEIILLFLPRKKEKISHSERFGVFFTNLS
jgi:hypothetical protein